MHSKVKMVDGESFTVKERGDEIAGLLRQEGHHVHVIELRDLSTGDSIWVGAAHVVSVREFESSEPLVASVSR